MASQQVSYAKVTEYPSQLASEEQWRMLLTRYALGYREAKEQCVLEVACGTGIGLGYLAETALRVYGIDIDQHNLEIAQATYEQIENVEIQLGDAHDLPFETASLDVVLCFEAIYYLKKPSQFMSEVHRVLRPGGIVLISTVNRTWHGFNPSDFAVSYPSAKELLSLADNFDSVKISAGFEDNPKGMASTLKSLIRVIAVKLRLVPRTMTGKKWLKRVFYGPLLTLPTALTSEMVKGTENLRDVFEINLGNFKVLYLYARKLR